MDFVITSALLIGFLGSTHCLGMCGGIVATINSGRREARKEDFLSNTLFHLSYNAGRIFSYSIAGVTAGFLGSQMAHLPLHDVLPWGGLFGGAFMVLLGLYIAGWWRVIATIEHAGAVVWKYIQPWSQLFLPVRGAAHAFGLGLVWGWLPCGLVYSALALAMISASPITGAFIMFAFGAGTLPTLLMMGKATDYLLRLSKNSAVRHISGAIVVLFGVYTGYTSLKGTHIHSATHEQQALNMEVGSPLDQARLAFSLMFDQLCLTPSDTPQVK